MPGAAVGQSAGHRLFCGHVLQVGPIPRHRTLGDGATWVRKRCETECLSPPVPMSEPRHCLHFYSATLGPVTLSCSGSAGRISRSRGEEGCTPPERRSSTVSDGAASAELQCREPGTLQILVVIDLETSASVRAHSTCLAQGSGLPCAGRPSTSRSWKWLSSWPGSPRAPRSSCDRTGGSLPWCCAPPGLGACEACTCRGAGRPASRPRFVLTHTYFCGCAWASCHALRN